MILELEIRLIYIINELGNSMFLIFYLGNISKLLHNLFLTNKLNKKNPKDMQFTIMVDKQKTFAYEKMKHYIFTYVTFQENANLFYVTPINNFINR